MFDSSCLRRPPNHMSRINKSAPLRAGEVMRSKLKNNSRGTWRSDIFQCDTGYIQYRLFRTLFCGLEKEHIFQTL